MVKTTRTSSFHGVPRLSVGLKSIPQPDQLEFVIPNSHCILVTSDGTSLTDQVVSQLIEKGNQVAVLDLKTLGVYSDENISQAINTIRIKHGAIGSVIHLHPHFEFEKGNFTQHFEAEKEIVKTVFFIAKHVQKELNELGTKQRVGFVSVTQLDGKLGQGKRGNVSVLGGGLTGLIKCLNLEWSSVFCRALDVQPELEINNKANQVITEFCDPDTSIMEVGFSEEGRCTTQTKPSEVFENQEIKTNVTSDSVFLVSGGARGVTATCVIEMSKAFQCKFILLGRSENDFELPPFAILESDENTLKRLIMEDMKSNGEKPSLPKVKSIFKNIIAKKEIDETIRAIETTGGEAIYIKGDVTELQSYKVALVQASKKLGAITAIIHGAGRLADKYIQDKTEADFENVLTVKLDGFLSLLRAVNLNQLEHLVLFSSVAGYYGNVGQTDYAIANEILSKAAHLFKTNHPKTHVSAINWGAWDSGMVSGELKAQFEAAGVVLVNSEGGAAMMVNEFSNAYFNEPQMIIGGTLPAGISHIGEPKTIRIHRKLVRSQNPFLEHHSIQGNPVLPVINAIGWMAQTCENIYPDFKAFEIDNVKLYKGIVFDGTEKENYILEIKELLKTAEKIVCEVTVLSEGRKLPTYHYKTNVTLIVKKNLLPAPKVDLSILDTSMNATTDELDGLSLYNEGRLFHGPMFQGIERIVKFTEEEMLVSCKTPQLTAVEQGQFPVQSINTFFADIQYQSMLIYAQKYGDANGLPLGTEKVELYKSIPFEKQMWVQLKVTSFSATELRADCISFDETGEVYMRSYGAALTISKTLSWK